ncbi:MAG: 50S ribosomal protein L25 [Planctomycetota bacterium]
MSTETIQVSKREGTGTLASKKLRQTGNIPAILYGHGEENVNLSVSAEAIHRAIENGVKLLTLAGDVTETALLRDVQWDAFGIDILHIDLFRVSADEAVEVTLPVELHGEAPGIGEGGKLSFPVHEVIISCPAGSIPEGLQINISELHMGQSIQAKDIKLPEGATVVTNPTEVVVHIPVPTAVRLAEAAAKQEAAKAEA